MAQCPECENDVGDDFGLIICDKCGSSLFIDMEGQAVSGQQAGAAAADADPKNSAFGTQYREFDFSESEEIPQEEPPQEEIPSDIEAEQESSELQEVDATDALVSAETEEAAQEEPPALPPLQEHTYADLEEAPAEVLEEQQFEEPLEEPAEEVLPEMSVVGEIDFSEPEEQPAPQFYNAPTTADFKDVMDFANSDLSQGHDGSLKYHLTISGIDTTDLRNELKEALSDKRFIWDIEAMIRGIRDGILEVDQVSAVKAYILVSRVAHLPIQITWIQQPLNQP